MIGAYEAHRLSIDQMVLLLSRSYVPHGRLQADARFATRVL